MSPAFASLVSAFASLDFFRYDTLQDLGYISAWKSLVFKSHCMACSIHHSWSEFHGDYESDSFNAKFSIFKIFNAKYGFFWQFSGYCMKNLNVKKKTHSFLWLNIKILTHTKCCHYVKETFVWIRFLIFSLYGVWLFFLTFFVFFTEWPEKVTQTSISRKVNLLRENPCRFESTNE
jgi:hypothetical protein